MPGRPVAQTSRTAHASPRRMALLPGPRSRARFQAFGGQYADQVSTAVESTRSLQKEWWLRALAIFQSPRTVFAALRDDSDDAAEARQEPVLAIIILAGIAGVLTTTLAGRLLDDYHFDGWNVAVWAFLGGILYGTVAYWLGGLLVHAFASALATIKKVS